MFKTLPALLLLSSSLRTVISQSACCSPNPPCLSSGEAANIALRWLSIFFTDSNGKGTGAGLVIPTIADNFTYYDEGFTLGKPGAIYKSRADLLSTVSGEGYVSLLQKNAVRKVLRKPPERCLCSHQPLGRFDLIVLIY